MGFLPTAHVEADIDGQSTGLAAVACRVSYPGHGHALVELELASGKTLEGPLIDGTMWPDNGRYELRFTDEYGREVTVRVQA